MRACQRTFTRDMLPATPIAAAYAICAMPCAAIRAAGAASIASPPPRVHGKHVTRDDVAARARAHYARVPRLCSARSAMRGKSALYRDGGGRDMKCRFAVYTLTPSRAMAGVYRCRDAMPLRHR